MVEDNPLVATVDDIASTRTDATGFGAAEAYSGLVSSIEGGSWIDVSVSGLGAALTGASMIIDPLGSLGSMAAEWCMEQIEPLKEALDDLAGNPEAVEAHALTWENVAGALMEVSTNMGTMIDNDIDGWLGDAADGYRDMADANADAAEFIGGMALALATATRGAGELVTMVREFVRGFIAECVGSLVSAAGNIALTGGIGALWEAPKMAVKIVGWVDRIYTLIDGLITSIGALKALLTGE